MKNSKNLIFKSKKNNSLFFSLFLSSLFLTSCNKYEEGPKFSLRTKTERVHNNWKISYAKEDGADVTSSYHRYELDLEKDGDAALSTNYDFAGVNYQYVTNGKWSFISDKEKLSFDFDNNDADGIYTILKLKEDEMWLSEDGKDIVLHFVTR
jgi:hypothetical protein